MLLTDEEVDVVVSNGSASGPRRKPATEHDRSLRFGERAGGSLHRVDEIDETFRGLVAHTGFYPAARFFEPRTRVVILDDAAGSHRGRGDIHASKEHRERPPARSRTPASVPTSSCSPAT